MNDEYKVRFFAKANIMPTALEEKQCDEKKEKAVDQEFIDDQPDLLRIDSVMVSVGMNLNDDVFLGSELLASRDTGRHKPLNLKHDDDRIVGHMTSTYPATKDGVRIEEAQILSDPDSVPMYFDLISESVMYAYVFPEEAREIREYAQTGELFVSVEAWFSDYDYAVGHRIVERNAITAAFIEPKLRVNGGDGLIKGQKVGRVLRNLIIAGIGLVEKPANKDSVIRSVCDEHVGTTLDVSEEFLRMLEENTKGFLFSKNPGEVVMAGKKELDKAQANASDEERQDGTETQETPQTEETGEVEQGSDESVEVTENKVEESIEAQDTEVTGSEVEDRLSKLEEQIATLKEEIVERDEKVTAYKAQLEEAKVIIAKLTEQIDKTSAEEAAPKEEEARPESEESTETLKDNPEAPAEEPPAEETPKEEPPAVEPKVEDAPVEEQPVEEEAPAEEPKEEPAVEPKPAEEKPVQKPAEDKADEPQEEPVSEEEAIEDAVEDALDKADKEEEVVDFTADNDGESSLFDQFVEVIDSLDIGVDRKTEEE